jgi:hypothetical protein
MNPAGEQPAGESGYPAGCSFQAPTGNEMFPWFVSMSFPLKNLHSWMIFPKKDLHL